MVPCVVSAVKFGTSELILSDIVVSPCSLDSGGESHKHARGSRKELASAVAVLEADDVVLSEIAPRLHLDQVQRDLARVLEPVRGADRDVGRLVLGKHHFLFAAADLSG